MKKITTLLSALALTVAAQAGEAPAPKNPIAPVIDPHANVIFAGLDMREYSWYTHLGYMYALNGDLGQSGLFLRAFVAAVRDRSPERWRRSHVLDTVLDTVLAGVAAGERSAYRSALADVALGSLGQGVSPRTTIPASTRPSSRQCAPLPRSHMGRSARAIASATTLARPR